MRQRMRQARPRDSSQPPRDTANKGNRGEVMREAWFRLCGEEYTTDTTPRVSRQHPYFSCQQYRNLTPRVDMLAAECFCWGRGTSGYYVFLMAQSPWLVCRIPGISRWYRSKSARHIIFLHQHPPPPPATLEVKPPSHAHPTLKETAPRLQKLQTEIPVLPPLNLPLKETPSLSLQLIAHWTASASETEVMMLDMPPKHSPRFQLGKKRSKNGLLWYTVGSTVLKLPVRTCKPKQTGTVEVTARVKQMIEKHEHAHPPKFFWPAEGNKTDQL
ncbi:hypothetical protein BaRGS_00028015 [Batillaria attramentaria]|uniref:Uncharacterized protein n=1 Tax=Batillaria attramentaria TaxID=370345 RepID=A0ABD0K0B8_9CAEN